MVEQDEQIHVWHWGRLPFFALGPEGIAHSYDGENWVKGLPVLLIEMPLWPGQ